VLRYAGAQLIGVGVVTPFDQTGMDALVANVEPAATDQMLDIRIDPAGAATRFSAARPAVPNLAFSWLVRAAPGHEFANNGGVNLHNAGVLMTDTMVQVAYANPFVARGWRSVLAWTASASRAVTPTGQTLATTLSAGMFEFVLEPGPAHVLALPAALPELIAIDGRNLSTDNMAITKPTVPVEITVITDGRATQLFEIELIEIAPNADSTALVQRRTLQMAGLEPRFFIPPEFLEAGKTYTIRAITNADSFPNLADGDLRTRTLPRSIAFLDSGVFQVMP
jgi:hypothetical protein